MPFSFWTEKRDTYMSYGEEFQADAQRCEKHVFRASLLRDEAEGKIVVYTGRAKPAWAHPNHPLARLIDNQIEATA